MGLMNKIKGAFGGGEDETDLDDIDVEDEFQTSASPDELIEDEEEDGTEPEPEPEGGPGPWDSAYDFAGWYLEDDGFANMTEFGEKAIMFRLQQSPMFRDRIQTGMETLQMVNKAKQQFRQIKGEESSSGDYEQMAEKLENANRVIDGMKSLNGEEEVMVQEGMSLARDAIEAIGSRTRRTGGNVDTDMSRSDRDI